MSVIRPEYFWMGLGPWYDGLIAAVESFKQQVATMDEKLEQQCKSTDSEQFDEQAIKRTRDMRSSLMETIQKYEYYIDRHSTTRKELPNVFYAFYAC